MALSNGPNDVSIALPPRRGLAGFFASHPVGFWFIFWGEFAERCSYYGMRAILSTYMADKLELGKRDAGTYMSFFIAACYFLPLVGGYLADNFFGKYRTIVWFSIPYILGHFILGIESPLYLFIALTLLAMGSGVIKPNISTLMGLTYDQERPGQEQLRSTAFAMFYMAINIGAAISQFAIPWIRTRFNSYWLAFLFPAVLMAVAFLIFAAGKKYYAKEIIVRRQKTAEESRLQWQVLSRIAGLFLLVMFFWAIFDQSASTWIFFANTYMDLTVFGYHIDPEQVQALNPVLIVVLLPLVTYLWGVFNRAGIKVRATDKMILGFVLTGLTMAVMAYAGFAAGDARERPKLENGQPVLKDGQQVMEQYVPPNEKVTVWWQMLAYLALTVAEILISVTGLELAFVAAPKNMKSFVTSLWLLTVGLANLFINAPVTRLYEDMKPGLYFSLLTGTIVVVTVAFVFVAARFNRLTAALASVEGPTADPRFDGQALPAAGASSDAIFDKSVKEGIVPSAAPDGVAKTGIKDPTG
jgi:POT family proton-dependent oligopeptide transporter